MSRAGYIIKIANFRTVWVSKMQTEIALSTTKAEYISLIQSMKYLIPLRKIMLDVSIVFGVKYDSCNSYTTTLEKKRAIELAKEPKYKTQTIHLSIKWHHFIKHIIQGTSKIAILKQINKNLTS